MTPGTPARMAVVKKEDKEQKLASFLERALQGAERGAELCLVAQGAASPVSRAIASLAARMTERGLRFRVIIAKAEAQALLPDGAACSYRHLADTRCHDAHELLVLGSTAAWVGDSMRRNPSATDSYELHVEACDPTTASIATSFERLWAIATPVEPSQSRSHAAGMELAGQLAALAAEGNTTFTALTRH